MHITVDDVNFCDHPECKKAVHQKECELHD